MANSVQQGNELENRVFEIFKKLIDHGGFCFAPKSTRVFLKKKYYSEERKNNIVFDITLETFVSPESSDYSYLTVIECKNYSHKVPVDDVEEFSSKLEQIGKHKTKGIIVTRTGFQEGSFNFAKSRGIALIKLKDDKSLEWILSRKSNDHNNHRILGVEESFLLAEQGKEGSQFIVFGHRFFQPSLNF